LEYVRERPVHEESDDLCEQGSALWKHFFTDAKEWCHRRALLLHFLEERRGQWTVNVDFDMPDVRHIRLLSPNEDRLRLPLLTFPKDLLPIAHVDIRDETDNLVSLENSLLSRKLALAVLLSRAEKAKLCVEHAPGLLWQLTDGNTISAFQAWTSLKNLSSTGAPTTPANLHGRLELAMAARMFYRSMYLVLLFRSADISARKIVEVSHDGPIRITRRWSETFGLSPFTIAPNAEFGGNAESYHVQILPPERLTVVDSRLLYGYFAPKALTDKSSYAYGSLADLRIEGSDGLLDRAGLTEWVKESSPVHWWGNVEGPAEPMSAHVRCSGDRMPGLEQGRDCYGIFLLYPQFSGLITQILVAGIINLLFVFAYVAGLQAGGLSDIPRNHPEVGFILAALVVGFGATLTLYPKEHLLTSAVMRPWRRGEALLIGFTIAVPFTSVWGNSPPMPVLWVEAGVDALVFVYVSLISYRPWDSETNGGQYWWTTGLGFRRSSFPDWVVQDDSEIADRELNDPAWRRERRRNLDSQQRRIERLYVKSYLVEDNRRALFNQGIPPATRHARSERAH
jgi:hypothetical protein